MPSLRDLRRQIGAIKNTAQVTKALQAVSGAKFRRAEARVKAARPYAENIEEMMRDIAGKATSRSPLLKGREVRRVAIATLTADRGLCGAFNAQVIRSTLQLRREQNAELIQVASGRKGISVFNFRRIELEESYSGFSDKPGYEAAQRMGRHLSELFNSEQADEVFLIYNRFVSALIQRPSIVRLLPVSQSEQMDGEAPGGTENSVPFEYIPDADEILETLIPRYVDTLVFQALLESAAGEHAARMTAMKNATDNAKEMARKLTLQMNKARQAQITREILEISAGADALAAG